MAVLPNRPLWDMLSCLLSEYGCQPPAEELEDTFARLHADQLTGRPDTHWRFGVSELSVVFDQQGGTRVRALAEVLNRCTARPSDVVALQELSWAVWESLAASALSDFDKTLFGDLIALVYAQPDSTVNGRPVRFGLAVEWRPARAPSLKCYFDLYTAGRNDAAWRLREVFHRLNLRSQWSAFSTLAASGDFDFACRGIGLDFSPTGGHNLRLYLPGSLWPVGRVRRLVDRCGWSELQWQLDLFNTHILRGRSEVEPVRSMLVGLVYGEGLHPARPVIKLDGHLAAHNVDDLASGRAVSSLSQSLGIPLPKFEQTLLTITNGQLPATLQGVMQYCSLDLCLQPKLGVYFRPLESPCEHADRQRSPRIKPSLLAGLDSAARRAVEALEGERASGFQRSTHCMRFPRSVGFKATTELQEGRVFQTALIATSLVFATRGGFEVDWDGILADIDYLANCRFREGRGGWRYFPNLPELPPDADDLAQILQLLLLSGLDVVDELCKSAVDLLLSGQRPDGSFDTWIVDPLLPAQAKLTFQQAIDVWWGAGPDPEVMANVLYALALWGRWEYEEHMAAAASYLAGQQMPDGSWTSTWYSGPFYGSWVCARAVRSVLPQHHTLGSVARFIAASQQPDGGWGSDVSDPTSTAQAVNCAVAVHDLLPDAETVLRRATEYLLREQDDDGIWRGNAFIKMELSRANCGMTSHRPTITYQSAALTTALALQALSAVRAVVDECT